MGNKKDYFSNMLSFQIKIMMWEVFLKFWKGKIDVRDLALRFDSYTYIRVKNEVYPQKLCG